MGSQKIRTNFFFHLPDFSVLNINLTGISVFNQPPEPLFYSLYGEYLSSGGNVLFNFHEAQDDDADGFDTMVVKEDDNDSEVRSLFLNSYSLKEGLR